ncbi:hypothetical protein GCM10007984_20850 [Shewanella putrefaciens]|nr:hypothetical protein GCM10007984_20850 [Shewanella putrefaciens]
MPRIAATNSSWANSIQLRRRPRKRVNKGKDSLSTSGDQAHLKAYAKAIQLK